MNRGNILFRVDGNATLGMGRLARSLALANALQRRRYQMTFLSKIDNNSWPERIRRFRHGVQKSSYGAGSREDKVEILTEIEKRNPVVVVTDSPEIDEEYLAMLSARVPLVISLDDHAKFRFPSDLVINPTLGLSTSDYTLYPGTQLVTGSRYSMIRSEFRRARTIRATEPGGPQRVLIALGGGDVVEDTMKFAKALLESQKIEKIDAVIGTTQTGRGALEALAAKNNERLTVSGDAKDLGVRMTKSHLLITGGGNTCMEAACVGIPMLVVARRATQVRNSTWLEEMGACQYLGTMDKVTDEQIVQTAESVLEDNFERKAMSRSGRQLVDGRGGDRIVTATEILRRRIRRAAAMAA